MALRTSSKIVIHWFGHVVVAATPVQTESLLIWWPEQSPVEGLELSELLDDGTPPLDPGLWAVPLEVFRHEDEEQIRFRLAGDPRRLTILEAASLSAGRDPFNVIDLERFLLATWDYSCRVIRATQAQELPHLLEQLRAAAHDPEEDHVSQQEQSS